MNADQQAQLFSNIAEAMAGVPERVKARQLAHFYQADPAYAAGVARLSDMDIDGVAAFAELSLQDLIEFTSQENYAGLPVQAGLPAAGA